MRRSFVRSQAYAFLTVLLWASTYVFTRIVLEHFSIAVLAFLRCAAASLFLAFVLAVARPGVPELKAAVPRFLLVGAAGFALYMPVFNKASMALNATTGCIVMAMSPIMTALLALGLFKERLNGGQWLAIGLAFSGILVMTLWNGTVVTTAGIAWMLLAAVCISAHNILQRGLTPRYGSLRVTAYGFFAGALLLSPFLPEAAAQVGA
ncbi:MAG: DMT family transporter, partial [Deltaproteobacteria bacterium]|nr:DMT family transporter [Deltaproteobacteria bacterium]